MANYQITIERSTIAGYWLGKINGKTVCCCRGKRATLANVEYLAKTVSPRTLAAMVA